MMMRLKIFFQVLFIAWASCSETPTTSTSLNKAGHLLTIDVQPFSDVPDGHIKYLADELKKRYPNIDIKTRIPLPSTAFYNKRNRYRADSLISYLKTRTPIGHVTIGLTTKDISHTKGQIEDYGIMGLGYQPGSSCVVSTFRLSKANLLEQYFKLSIHELGHTQGLPHCVIKTCYMRDAEGKNNTDEEIDFCSKCKSILISKGWSFPN